MAQPQPWPAIWIVTRPTLRPDLARNTSMDAQPPATAPARALGVLSSLFFMLGFITGLNDILVPHLKAVFTLSYFQATLVQFCFFMAYAVTAIPFGRLVGRLGYKQGVIGGFLIAALGCTLFYPAAASGFYPLFLTALFILASGITLLQVSGNPYVTLLAPAGREARALTLAQAFASAGTTLAPLVGAYLILGPQLAAPAEITAPSAGEALAWRSAQASAVQLPYLGLAAILLLLAFAIHLMRLPGTDRIQQERTAQLPAMKTSVWHYRHLLLGAAAIFCYVGAEVAIGSLLVNVLGLKEVAGLGHQQAATCLAFYWGGSMAGRFLGSLVLNRFDPGKCLAFNALVNVLLILAAISFSGPVAMYGLLAVGFFNSIMFPTIFSLGTRGLGQFTSAGSGIMASAIVGGAIIPVLQGLLADHHGLLVSFLLSAACYVYIIYFGLHGHRAD